MLLSTSKIVTRLFLSLLLLNFLTITPAFSMQDPMFDDPNPLNIKRNEKDISSSPAFTTITSSDASLSNTIVVVGTRMSQLNSERVCNQIKESIWDVLYSNVHCVISEPSISYQQAIINKIPDLSIRSNSRFVVHVTETSTPNEALFTVVDTHVVVSKSSALLQSQSVRIKNLAEVKVDFFKSEINRLVLFFINQNKIRDFWVKQAAALTTNMTYDQKTRQLYLCEKKTVLDAPLNDLGQRQVVCEKPSVIPPETASKRILTKQEDKDSPNYLRAALELSTVIGISAFWYFSSEEAQDWHYDSLSVGQQLKNKFVSFEAWHYDDNNFSTNLKHIFPAGWSYYGFARANGISAPWSLLISFAVSTLAWDSGVEFWEVTSVNDVIFTPLGGFVIAEAGYQLAKALKDQPGVLNQILGSILNPFTTINDILDSPTKFLSRFNFKKPNPNVFNGVEFQPDYFSEMKISFGVDAFQRQNSDQDTAVSVKVGLSGEKINIPAYLLPGHDKDYFTTVLGSMMDLETSAYGSPNRSQIYIQNLLSGYYAKSISKGKDGLLHGYSLVIAPSMGLSVNNFEYQNSTDNNNQNQNPKDDFSAILHVLGASGKLIVLKGSTRVTFDLNFSGDLAMVKSYALEKFTNGQNNLSQVSSFIREQKYYHGMGWSVRGGVKAENNDWKTGVAFVHTMLWDLNPDIGTPAMPASDVIQSSVNIRDEISKLTIFLGKDVTENLEVRLEGRILKRWGAVDTVGVSTTDYYGGLQLSYKLY